MWTLEASLAKVVGAFNITPKILVISELELYDILAQMLDVSMNT